MLIVASVAVPFPFCCAPLRGREAKARWRSENWCYKCCVYEKYYGVLKILLEPCGVCCWFGMLTLIGFALCSERAYIGLTSM